MKIAVFGSGYVGLVTSSCLADVGHVVTCVDVDAARIAELNAGRVPIYEPGLGDLLSRNMADARLGFATDPRPAVETAEIIFIAVDTPPGANGAADLTHVLAVARTIGTFVNADTIVVDKSTVPVGTSELVLEVIGTAMRARGVTHGVEVCANPEFLKEGDAIEDFTRGARIVVGTRSERVREAMRACYAPYNRNHDKVMFMGPREAELTKYAANAMLATKISFMNEIAMLGERLGADIEEVRRGIGSDPRIGYHFIYPGAGYGGSCLPKDVRALIHMARGAAHEPHLLAAVETVNTLQQHTLFDKLAMAFDDDLAGKCIAVWGLAFKPNTSDMREAPSRRLIEALWERGARVRAFDPAAMGEARRLYADRADFLLCPNPKSAVEGADALVICTEWKQFRVVDLNWLKATLTFPIVVDGRNLYDPTEMKRQGLLYYAVARGASLRSSPQRIAPGGLG